LDFLQQAGIILRFLVFSTTLDIVNDPISK
jgi:hypothetical protein